MRSKQSSPRAARRVREGPRTNAERHDEIWGRRELLDGTALIARDGDRHARNLLWTVVRPRLSRVALGLGVEFDEAADLVQDVLLRAERNLHKFDPAKGSFRTWLIAILTHLKHNLSRSKRRRARLLDAIRRRIDRFRSAGGGSDVQRLESSLELSRLLSTLTARQREVLMLYGIGGLSAREAGRVLGIAAESVRSIARDARRNLRISIRSRGRAR